MRLDPDWKRILKRAYSIRFLLLAGLFSGLETAMPLLHTVLPVPAGIFAVLSGLSVAGAFVFRLVAQKDF
ncbi:MAG: hypothetical protein DI537_13695 [Stutzerimonas stutzeri]|nr:MAG: hypothetical protein DI537_13695 [Stutzerimonas stutzeri]